MFFRPLPATFGAAALGAAVLLSLTAACGQDNSASRASALPPPDAAAAQASDATADSAAAYACADGFRFAARAGAGTALVLVRDTTARLPRVRSASGAKYAHAGTTFWSKGDEALFEIGSTARQGCQPSAPETAWEEAFVRGAAVRAIGQEPGWFLEIILGDRITFVADYGERRIVTPAPAPRRAAGATVYHAKTEAHTLDVRLREARCRDVMSGRPYALTVTVTLGGQAYNGCGTRLR